MSAGAGDRVQTPQATTSDASGRPARRKRGGFGLDAESRVLLGRFLSDWVKPRWRELLTALLLTAGLAAATGAYPMVIKFSFDNLLKGDVAWLPWVLVAIIVITAARSVFLYMQS